jgi:hypothetical protein
MMIALIVANGDSLGKIKHVEESVLHPSLESLCARYLKLTFTDP